MPYTAEISRANPSCFLFLIDQSGSMQDVMDPSNVQPMDAPMTVDGRTYTHTAQAALRLREWPMQLTAGCESSSSSAPKMKGLVTIIRLGSSDMVHKLDLH